MQSNSTSLFPLLTLGIQTFGVQNSFPSSDFDNFHPISIDLINDRDHDHLYKEYDQDNLEVRSISCGGTFFVIRLWNKRNIHHRDDDYQIDEKLLVKFSTPKLNMEFFKPLTLNYKEQQLANDRDDDNNDDNTTSGSQSNDRNPFYLLDYKSAIEKNSEKCYDVKNVYCIQSLIILQMRNNLLVIFENGKGSAQYYKKFMEDKNIEIKEIVSGPLSLHILVRTSDNFIYYLGADSSRLVEKRNLNLDFTDKKYVMSALSGRSSFVVYETSDGSHEILCHGDDQFLSQNGCQSHDRFIVMNTPFQGQRISQIKCGYFHTAVILENGDVYMCGYNAYSQCGVVGSDQHFIKINFPTFPLKPVDTTEPLNNEGIPTKFQPNRVICSSISTAFVNDHGFIIIGDMVKSYAKRYIFSGDGSSANSVKCIYREFGKEEKLNNQETNTIECGGWHFVVFNKKVTQSKCLKYFIENLNKIVGSDYFSDIQF